MRRFSIRLRWAVRGRSNGESGFTPPHFLALKAAVDARDTDALTALAEHGPLCVAVDPATPAGSEIADWVAAHPLSVKLSGAGRRHFKLRRASAEPFETSGNPLPVAEASSHVGPLALEPITDGDRMTAWVTTGAQQGDEHLTVTLGCSATVTQVDLSQGGYVTQFARGLALDVSSDRSLWRTVWQGTAGGLTLRAALRDGRSVTKYLPVGIPEIRHVRFRALTSDPVAEWAVADVIVRGRCSP